MSARENKKFLSLFFEEKEIPYTMFEITDKNGCFHLISTEVVKEWIFSLEYGVSQNQLVKKIRQLDFINAPFIPFMRYIADFIVNNR